MKQKRFETRMVLTVPTRGIITIEGSQEFVRKFFDDVRSQFVNEVSYALKYDPAMKGKDFEVVETHHGSKETSLSVVEKTGT